MVAWLITAAAMGCFRDKRPAALRSRHATTMGKGERLTDGEHIL